MASWMIHLRIADQLLNDRIVGLDIPAFLIGNIAPDSGLPNADWTKFDPPKSVTHYDNGQLGYRMGDWRFYQAYLADVSRDDIARLSFLWGYFFHLVTDNFWLYEIWRPTRQHLSNPPTSEETAEVKRDWYGQDFIYIRDHRAADFWQRFLSAKYDPAWFDLVPAAGIEHSLNHIRTFYERTDDAIQATYTRDYRFLSWKQADEFVESAVWRLYLIYQRLEAGEAISAEHSVLEHFQSLATSD